MSVKFYLSRDVLDIDRASQDWRWLLELVLNVLRESHHHARSAVI